MIFLDLGIIFCAAIVGYCYLLYPVIIRLLARKYPKPTVKDETYFPTISIILAVHNEERVIEGCLHSLFNFDYPKEKIEILIGSDGSSDKTNEIIAGYQHTYEFIKPFFFEDQRGKMQVLNDLVKKASGEILFFADADIELSPNTLKLHVCYFSDEEIGAVAGFYQVQSKDHSALYLSEHQYTSLEQQIRISESNYYSTLGLFGGNYSLRNHLWKPLPDGLVHDDFFIVLSVLDQKHRVVFEPQSIATDFFARTLPEEFRRKSRSASRGYHTLSFFPSIILPRSGKAALLLWSHKLLRWLSPFIMTLMVSLALVGYLSAPNVFYALILSGVIGLGVLTFIGMILNTLGLTVPIIHQLSWFIIMNFAYIVGTVKYLTHSDEQIWKPSSRAQKSHQPIVDVS